MATLGLCWGLRRWTATMLGCFFSICRIGEFLKARRCDVLLPCDILEDEQVIYVNIDEPKTRRRGARRQYATINQPDVVRFLSAVWQGLARDELLYGSSAGAFRHRWDALLTCGQATSNHSGFSQRRRSRMGPQKRFAHSRFDVANARPPSADFSSLFARDDSSFGPACAAP